MSFDENTENDSTARAGPGPQLRRVRESRQISLEDISHRTHISVSRLQALEENRFDVLGPEPFVIGYIRKFAKLLEIDSDSLVDEYRSQCGLVDESRASAVKSHSSKSPSIPVVPAGPGMPTIATRNIVHTIKHLPGWWIVGGLVAIWIIGAYLLVPGDETQPTIQPTQTEVEHPEREAPAPLANEKVVDDEATSEEVVDYGQVVAKPTGEPPKNELVAGDRNSLRGQSDGTFAIAPQRQEENAASVGETGQQATEAGVDTSRAVNQATATGDDNGRDLLVISFTEECWVEVNDANGRNIVAALQTPADTLRLTGQAPFTVMLGNARAVSLTINGRAVEINPRPGRNTLRLTVSP